MGAYPFILVSPSTRGLSLALTRHYLCTTKLPVYATFRNGSIKSVSENILSSLPDVDASRLKLLPLDLTREDSISAAAQQLSDTLPKDQDSYLQTGFFAGGVLHPERQPADLDASAIQQTFQINVIAQLLMIKHFSRFLPSARMADLEGGMAKWVHVSARVGSISDNKRGGWYSYRASKAALNQVVKTFDLQLQMKKAPAMCVGVHPGTVKTELSRDFWGGVGKDKLFEPEYAAERLAGVVRELYKYDHPV
ncbi:NAD-P-binding protein [Artomyces pyxidatus]|uniref:NAD-P-binding protein n=1 Tax=Artomyces pyxidatus TaxID=48021 RepID=A0ACB8TKM7_9AGAM|nr:NAD-P-binding protein [Artomyces pyxidatus]